MKIDFEILKALSDTGVMVIIPSICAVVFGIPLGALIFLTGKNGIKENMYIYIPCNMYVNIIRSFPFLIFVVVLIPVTRIIFGTAFGLLPASFPICFIAVALYARFVEQSFHDVSSGIIEAAFSMKADIFQIVRHFLIVESRSSLVLGLTSTIISCISYSTVMGIVGGGGIGDYAVRYGYNEYNYRLVFKVVIIMIAVVFTIQNTGNMISKKLDRRRRY